MQAMHASFQQDIANLEFGQKDVLDYGNFEMLMQYLNVVPARVPIKEDLGVKIVNSLCDSQCMNDEQRLQSAVQIMKLVSVRPDLEGLLHGLELDQIHLFQELVKIAESN